LCPTKVVLLDQATGFGADSGDHFPLGNTSFANVLPGSDITITVTVKVFVQSEAQLP